MTVQLVGWALIHSLWQGAVAAVLLGVTLSMLRKSPAAWRHTACLVALVAIPVLAVGMSVRTITNTAAAPTAGTPQEALEAERATPRSPRLERLQTPAQTGGVVPPVNSTSRVRVDVERVLPWVVGVWLFGVLLLSLRVIGGYVRARRLVHDAVYPVSADITETAKRIAGRLRVTAAARVLASAQAQVPMVIGMIRPVVLMPASLLTGLTLQQVEAILAHELAHVRRYDYAINLLQTIVETLFFYHPAIWWMSRRMRDEREQACDELAVSLCGGDPIFYSRVLLAVEEWRGARISFAPAATGGSLAVRIRKLIGEDQRKLDVGPRWFAGVVTVAGVVFATGSVVSDKADAQSLKLLQEVSSTQDTARARPASVHKFSGAGSLEERVKWATETARKQNLDRYWLGYIVRGNTTSDWLYIDRGSAVQAGDSWFSGHMRFSGEFNNLKFSGISLGKLVGDYSPNDHAIFLAFDATSRRARLVRVRLANFAFPMHFNRWPLLWLDEVPAAQSVKVLAGLRDAAATKEVMGDLPAAIGAHVESGVVLPVLLGWLQDSSAPHEFRVETVEALAYHGSPEALAAVTRIARGNENEDLRAEAIEALGEMPLRAAADSLMSLASTLKSERLRGEAIESLGERPEEHVAAWLERTARTADPALSAEAIEALAELPGQSAPILVSLAGDAAVQLATRLEAIEALSEMDAASALTTLRRIVEADADGSAQIKATEALGNVEDPRAVGILKELANTHPSTQVKLEAVEALGNVHYHDAALAALTSIADSHEQFAIRVEALEALGNLSGDGKGAAALMKYIRSNKAEEALIGKALEALANGDDTDGVVEFIAEFLRSGVSVGLKLQALETLDGLHDDAGVPLLREYARSRETSLREKAAKLLEDRKN